MINVRFTNYLSRYLISKVIASKEDFLSLHLVASEIEFLEAQDIPYEKQADGNCLVNVQEIRTRFCH